MAECVLDTDALEDETVIASARVAYEEMTRESRQEGRNEGRQEGVLGGERFVLLWQLERRFGELPYWMLPRLRAGGARELERWADRVLDADTLDGVLAR